MRFVSLALLSALLAGCAGADPDRQPAASAAEPAAAPRDAAHEGIMGPHGDHTPHHGGLVLMNGDIHYEVVFGRDGRHEVWFTDAMRNDLPASVARGVTMEVSRPGTPVEILQFQIDDAGEAWVASGRPLDGDGIMVKVRYDLQGEPFEIEIPAVQGQLPESQ